ncbi:MAG: CidA/LrgA family protein [Eubacterium sp.]|nr:CidA/LrgA family protein [Candidatus Colimonas fimequi]
MKYIKQFTIIILISFVGEVLNYLIPLPIPASVYGMVIMLALLCSGILKVETVRETAMYLILIMPIMFIPAAAGLINSWDMIQPRLIQYAVVTIVSLVIVMLLSGWATQLVIKKGGK